MENLPPQNDDHNIPEEEELIPNQAPADNNDWVEEDPEEEEEDDEEDPEENPEEAEDEEMEVDEEENHSEVSEPDEPPTPVYQSTYHVGESSTTRALLDGNSEVFPPGHTPIDLWTVHARSTKLEKQMFERYTTEFKIKNKFKEIDIRMHNQGSEISSNYSDMMWLIKDLSEQVEELRLKCRRGKCLSQWEAQVRPQIPEGLRFREEPPVLPVLVPRADDPYVMVREAALAAEDDDADTAEDPQPSEFRGSSRDP
ncbi:hypothetical protein Tco_1307000 [Tanacetum coccineum]